MLGTLHSGNVFVQRCNIEQTLFGTYRTVLNDTVIHPLHVFLGDVH